LVGMMPGILANAVWFHPDFLMSFLILKTFYYLDNPKTEIGSRSYKLSVLFFSLAVSVKIQALSFLPAFAWVFIRSCFINKSVSHQIFIFFIYSIISVILIYIVLNPFLFKGEGRLAWMKSFTGNMLSNTTGHSTGDDLNYSFRLANGVLNYYFPIPLLILTIIFAVKNIVLSISCLSSGNNQYFPNKFPAISMCLIVNLGYNVLFINKGWHHYYLCPMLLSVPILINGLNDLVQSLIKSGLVPRKNGKKLALIGLSWSMILLLQFQAYHKDLALIVKNRLNGVVISADSIYRYQPESKSKLAEKLKVEELMRLLCDVWTDQSIALISPYVGFPFYDLNAKFAQVRTIYGPLSKNVLDKTINQNGRLDIVIISKNDLYFDLNNGKRRTDYSKYVNARQKIDEWKKGLSGFQLRSESDNFYLFESTNPRASGSQNW
jgi:hypothetical protein